MGAGEDAGRRPESGQGEDPAQVANAVEAVLPAECTTISLSDWVANGDRAPPVAHGRRQGADLAAMMAAGLAVLGVERLVAARDADIASRVRASKESIDHASH